MEHLKCCFSAVSSTLQIYRMLPPLLRMLPLPFQKAFQNMNMLRKSLADQVSQHKKSCVPGEPRDLIDCYLDEMEKVPQYMFNHQCPLLAYTPQYKLESLLAQGHQEVAYNWLLYLTRSESWAMQGFPSSGYKRLIRVDQVPVACLYNSSAALLIDWQEKRDGWYFAVLNTIQILQSTYPIMWSTQGRCVRPNIQNLFPSFHWRPDYQGD